MPLNPQAEQVRQRRIADGAPPLYTQSLAEARAADLADIQAGSGEQEPVHQVIDRDFPATGGPVRLRLYRPDRPGQLPVLVYFFGGGWTLGQIETCDAVCRTLTNLAGCLTVAVGYRLAPEHKFPAALTDCYEAVCWLAQRAGELELDPSRMVVGGDSAGGNLAAAVTLLIRDRGGPALAGQLLVYPNTLYGADTPSMRFDDPSLFNRRSVAWYWQHYLDSPAQGTDPLVSPLLATDLSGLPPALVITAECDPLRDEGEQYAGRLAEAGVPVRQHRFDGVMHGFFTMSGVLDDAERALRQAADFLRDRFAR
ncbi:MAG: alpha/beta hydrolase [Jatrophihabitantaceae bacterium]